MKSEKSPRPPDRGKTLYGNIFQDHDSDFIINTLSEGIYAVIDNALGLLNDAEILVNAKSFSCAGFLRATADEEMAKVYIIIDMCRLNFDKHESVLIKLCQAFYDHVKKHAYNEVVRFPNVYDMKHVKEIYEVETIKWFPAGIDSGEPDMPHETVFRREFNLYVDYIGSDQKWFIPTPDSCIMGNDNLEIALRESHEALDKLIYTRDLGLFKAEALGILNDVFKNHYIRESTKNNELADISEKYAKKTNETLGILVEGIAKSTIISWPLYCLVSS